MESQQAVLSADAAADSRFGSEKRFDAGESPDAAPHRSLMCAPLIDGEGRSFGVLQLGGADPKQPFCEDDLEIFIAVAIQVSIAIDNARLHEKSARQQDIEHDCDLADRLQQAVLPARTPEFRGYRFYQYYRPAPNVGGDFYDYVLMYDGRLMVFMADITGHGLAAAMLIARLALEIRASLLISSHPADMMQNLNRALFAYLPQDYFIKLLALELVPASGEVTLVNAGHRQPLLRTPDGRISQIESGLEGLPLGVCDDAQYADSRFVLPPGGMLILYTDGTGQATDPSGQAYGHERIRSQAAAAHGGPAELGECLAGDVRQFIAGSAQRDDICLVCLGRE
jgi:serine phosphatase RsbU (regulator of sigma subunit)